MNMVVMSLKPQGMECLILDLDYNPMDTGHDTIRDINYHQTQAIIDN